VFAELDSFMYERAQRYMKRRHPRKSGWWRTQKYWGRTIGRQDRWILQDKDRHATLREFAWTPIVRHRLVPTTYAPDDPPLHHYWRQRRARPPALTYRQRHLAQRQHGRCPVCHQHLDNGEVLHHAPCRAKAPGWHGGPRESATRACELPSSDSQHQCASRSTSMA
jgi:RNA-directed DNA polymerase